MSLSLPTVFVVDDDENTLQALSRHLRKAKYRVETFVSGRDFLDNYYEDTSGCLILNAQLKDINGLELQQKLRKVDCELPIIFISNHVDIPILVQAMKGGAVNFFAKPVEDKELLPAVNEALQLNSSLHEKHQQKTELLSRQNTLTPRERQVFELVVTGMLNKQIAYALGVTEKTIKVHRSRVMKKMKVVSLAELVHAAEILKIGLAKE